MGVGNCLAGRARGNILNLVRCASPKTSDVYVSTYFHLLRLVVEDVELDCEVSSSKLDLEEVLSLLAFSLSVSTMLLALLSKLVLLLYSVLFLKPSLVLSLT